MHDNAFQAFNAPETFQNVMNTVLGEDNRKCTILYLDDVIIFSKNIEEYKQHVEDVQEEIKAVGANTKYGKMQVLPM